MDRIVLKPNFDKLSKNIPLHRVFENCLRIEQDKYRQVVNLVKDYGFPNPDDFAYLIGIIKIENLCNELLNLGTIDPQNRRASNVIKLMNLYQKYFSLVEVRENEELVIFDLNSKEHSKVKEFIIGEIAHQYKLALIPKEKKANKRLGIDDPEFVRDMLRAGIDRALSEIPVKTKNPIKTLTSTIKNTCRVISNFILTNPPSKKMGKAERIDFILSMYEIAGLDLSHINAYMFIADNYSRGKTMYSYKGELGTSINIDI